MMISTRCEKTTIAVLRKSPTLSPMPMGRGVFPNSYRMTITKAKAENKSIEWATPQNLFDYLDKHYHFTLDPAASKLNAKCERYYTKEKNGLLQSWKGERVWLNPPYGRELPAWIEKAQREVKENDCALVVAIFPPRTDTIWFQKYVSNAASIWFLRGRVHFKNPDNPADRPQDPSCIVVFEEHCKEQQVFYWDWKKDV